MSEDLMALARRLRDRGVSQQIIDRVVRLNPGYKSGHFARGIHFQRFYDGSHEAFICGFVRKSEFLKKHGRAAYADLPRGCIRKIGRREFISLRAVEDWAWERSRLVGCEAK